MDNGSGTVGVMALAKIFSQFSFARTIEYIAFGAEEQGLHGSAHYVAQAQAAGEDIVCALTMDMIGYSNRYFGTAPHLCTLSLFFLRMACFVRAKSVRFLSHHPCREGLLLSCAVLMADCAPLPRQA